MTGTVPKAQRVKAATSAWSRVARLIEAYPDVKQVRLNMNERSVTVGFYESPAEETLNRIKSRRVRDAR